MSFRPPQKKTSLPCVGVGVCFVLGASSIRPFWAGLGGGGGKPPLALGGKGHQMQMQSQPGESSGRRFSQRLARAVEGKPSRKLEKVALCQDKPMREYIYIYIFLDIQISCLGTVRWTSLT